MTSTAESALPHALHTHVAANIRKRPASFAVLPSAAPEGAPGAARAFVPQGHPPAGVSQLARLWAFTLWRFRT
jgi:hypothetical protein